MSKEKPILKEDTFKPTRTRMDKSINNGRLSMLTNGRVNQLKVSSMKNMDFMSKDHSTSFQLWVQEDTLRSSTTEILSSRLETLKEDKSGGSTKDLLQSRPESTTSHGISKAMAVAARWKSKEPTHNGGRSSSIEVNNSSTSRTRRFLMYQEEKMLKLNQLLLTRATMERTRDGKLFMLIRLINSRPRDSTKNLASTSTDHSISDQECQ